MKYVEETIAHNAHDRWSEVEDRYARIKPAVLALGGSLDRIVSERKSRSKNAHVIELFGPGKDIRPVEFHNADSYTGVRLSPAPIEGGRSIRTNLYTVAGRRMAKMNLHVPGDFVIVNANGALNFSKVRNLKLEDWSAFLRDFYNWTYSISSRNDGVIISDVMEFIPAGETAMSWAAKKREYFKAVEDLWRSKGIDIEIMSPNISGAYVLILKKHYDSPPMLPPLPRYVC